MEGIGSKAARVGVKHGHFQWRDKTDIVGHMQAKVDTLLLRGHEVAQALNISRAQAYRWMQTGILPTVRVAGGRSVRVPREALTRWINENTHTGQASQERSASPRS
jgi:excisionase family DNA binding protein